jgi:hypothetical protein
MQQDKKRTVLRGKPIDVNVTVTVHVHPPEQDELRRYSPLLGAGDTVRVLAEKGNKDDRLETKD